MVNNNPSPSACLEALNKISYEDFLKFSHQLFSHTYVEGMIHGNLTQQEAQQIWNQYLSTLQPEPFAKTDHYKIAVLIPSEKEGPFAISKPTERQGNSALLTIYQAPFSLQDFAFQQILSSTLQDDFFDTLRTKQQTGYIASSWSSEIEDQLFQWFGVQSITHDSSELLARFELFIEDFSKELSEKVSPERFETLKQTLIEDLRMPAENLHSKTSELHTLAFKRKGDFEWKQKLIQSVEKLSYATFTQKTEAFLSRSNKRRIAILMHGVLPQQHQFRYEHITEEKMRDIGSYISSK
jgi:insulysin